MATRRPPQVGQWYAHRDKGQMFQVVAVEEGSAVEIQDLDGDVDEIDYEAWFRMPLVAAEPPEDGRGPVDTDEADAFADDADLEAGPRDWRSPLDDLPGLPQDLTEEDDLDEGRTAH